MKELYTAKMTLSIILFLLGPISFSQTANQDSLKSIKTIGLFDGKKITVGNYMSVVVYKINDYCISPEDISQSLADSLSGKIIVVTGKLKIVTGKTFPALKSNEGRIYEPYKEPDRKFIIEPSFKILE